MLSRFRVFLIVFLLLFFTALMPGLPSYERKKVFAARAESSGPGMDLVLVIDMSGSMKVSDPDYLCLEAAGSCIEKIRDLETSRVGIVPFSDRLGEITPLTDLSSEDGRLRIGEAISALEYTDGDTDIGLAMQAAVKLLVEGRQEGEETGGSRNYGRIVLLTDGEIDLPAAENEQEAEKRSLTDALLAVEEAKENSFYIDTVALRVTGPVDENLMNYMAEMTGGSFHLVENASELPDLYMKLPDKAKKLIPEEETQTEPDSPAEPETEAETVAETESEPLIIFSGTIEDPVVLTALIPSLCKGRLDLSRLFTGAGNLSFLAYTQMEGIADCSVEGSMMSLKGISNGITRVIVRAEAEDGTYLDTDFILEVKAFIPSVWYLLLLPLSGAGIFIILIVIRNCKRAFHPADELCGMVSWYLKSEDEQIYGVPEMQLTDLSEYGKRVRLADFVEDDLLDTADLKKVIFCTGEDGVRVECRKGGCVIYSEDTGITDRLELYDNCRFNILCKTDEGRLAIVLLYSMDMGAYTDEDEEDEGERTRLLI